MMYGNNYESARIALGICMDACLVWGEFSVEMLLPADDRYDVCTPDHLTAALGLAGIDATLVETPAVGAVMHDAVRRGAIVLCLAGLHSPVQLQRWLVAYNVTERCVEMVGGGFDDAFTSPEPAHFRPFVIVVRGRQDANRPPYQLPSSLK